MARYLLDPFVFVDAAGIGNITEDVILTLTPGTSYGAGGTNLHQLTGWSFEFELVDEVTGVTLDVPPILNIFDTLGLPNPYEVTIVDSAPVANVFNPTPIEQTGDVVADPITSSPTIADAITLTLV